MILFNNGIVVQALNKERIDFKYKGNFTDTEFENFKSYKGLGRYLSWPLEREEDKLSKQLTAETKKWFVNDFPNGGISYNPRIIPDEAFCIKYLSYCKEKGIKVRVMFCKTEMKKPIWNSPIPKLNFLGFDYAIPMDFYSTIPEDLLNPDRRYLSNNIYQALIQCKYKLNNNKLFSNEIDILKYINSRERVIRSDIQLDFTISQEHPAHLVEDFGNFMIFQVSEVVGEF